MAEDPSDTWLKELILKEKLKKLKKRKKIKNGGRKNE